MAFPDGAVGEEFTCNAGDPGDEGLIPGLGRSPGEGNVNPFQYSCLGNPRDREAWQSTVHQHFYMEETEFFFQLFFFCTPKHHLFFSPY